MDIHIHRQYIDRTYTVSEIRYPGGCLQLLEPPVAGLTGTGLCVPAAGEDRLYMKKLWDDFYPCFPKHGRDFRYYLCPLQLRIHVDDISFVCPYAGCAHLRPLYAGRYEDEGFMEPDPEAWEAFAAKLLQTFRHHELIRVLFTA